MIGIRLAIALAIFASLPSLARAWTVERTQGDVQMGTKSKAVMGALLKTGDEVVTGKDGHALLKDGESEVWLAPQTHFKVHQLADSEKDVMGRLDLLRGKIRAHFKRPGGPAPYPYEIKARTVVAGVRGTEFFVAVEDKDEKVCTLDGLVRVSSFSASGGSSGEGWDVPAGKGLFVKPGEMPKVRETSGEQKKNWVDATTF